MRPNDDEKYVIFYKQPMLATGHSLSSKRDLIWKKEEEGIYASNDGEADQKMRLFMEQGALVVGTMTYQRSLTKLVKFFPYRVVKDFIPGRNHPSKLSA